MKFDKIQRYEDNLWYPILVKIGGNHKIVEMQGRDVNRWNDMVANQRTRIYPMRETVIPELIESIETLIKAVDQYQEECMNDFAWKEIESVQKYLTQFKEQK